MIHTILFIFTFLSFTYLYADDATVSGGTDEVYVQDTKAVSLSPADHIMSRFDYTDLANRFIDPKGNLGDYGQSVVAAIQRVGMDCFMNKLDLSQMCPGFSKMSEADKLNKFYPYFFGAIAIGEAEYQFRRGGNAVGGGRKRHAFDEKHYLESDEKYQQNTPYRLTGLFRLEKAKSVRRGNGRPKSFCETIDSFQEQATCTAGMISQLHCSRSVPLNRGYWISLRDSGQRPGAGVASKMIQSYPGCKAQ